MSLALQGGDSLLLQDGSGGILLLDTTVKISLPSPLSAPEVFASIDPRAAIATPGPLGSPELQALDQYTFVQAPSPLAAPYVVASSSLVFVEALTPLGAPSTLTLDQNVIATTPSPLGAPKNFAFTDFSAQVSDIDPRYIMRITGDPVLEIPISSWQATLQTDRQTYLQCVIPAAGEYAADLAARRGVSDVVVYRVVEFAGLQLESEMARVPLSTISSSQGPFRSTSVVSGYTDAVVTTVERDTVALEGVRSITQDAGGSVRFRSNIDWFLRPGQDCSAGGLEITVGYMNYYVTSEGDAYMDVGTRG